MAGEISCTLLSAPRSDLLCMICILVIYLYIFRQPLGLAPYARSPIVAGISSSHQSAYVRRAMQLVLTDLSGEKLLDVSQNTDVLKRGEVDGNTFSAKST